MQRQHMTNAIASAEAMAHMRAETVRALDSIKETLERYYVGLLTEHETVVKLRSI